MKRQIAIFGSTGSVGRAALEVVRRFPGQFRVRVLAARGRRIHALLRQAAEFQPDYLVVTDGDAAAGINGHLPERMKLITGPDALTEVLDSITPDLILHAVVGAAGLPAAMAAVQKGVALAIANKESLVCAGEFLRRAAEKSGAALLPVDSEHNAVFQVLVGENPRSISKILLTASGGPFFNNGKLLSRVTPREALRHPNWKMGPKITVDSATLMNKALEIIEAKYLFDVPPEKIGVVIHPESIVHSMVEFVDGSVKMQAAVPDMRLPIQYALFYPQRRDRCVARLNLPRLKSLSFFEPDHRRFPSILLAYRALKLRGSAPAVLSAANEVAVAAFLAGQIRFDHIFDVIRKTFNATPSFHAGGLEDILRADRLARIRAAAVVENTSCTTSSAR